MVRKRRKSRLLPSIQKRLLEQFAAGVSARTAAELVGINRNTAILYFHKLREIIAEQMAAEAPFLAGEIEVDESYFGGVRKGKRGRGAGGKVPVFGLLKRGGRVSMADTNCTRWRRKTVPVWLIEKGAHAPGLVRLVCCAL